MNRTAAATVAGLALLVAAPVAVADAVADLIATDKRMQRAFVDRDIAALEEIFTDDYVLVLWNGAERSKREVIESVRSPDTRREVNETSGWSIARDERTPQRPLRAIG